MSKKEWPQGNFKRIIELQKLFENSKLGKLNKTISNSPLFKKVEFAEPLIADDLLDLIIDIKGYSLPDSCNEASDISDNKSCNKIVVNVPPSLWAGKHPEAIYASLHAAGFCNEVIAYILVEKMNIPLTEAGRLLSSEEIAQGKERELKTYRERVSGMVEKAKRLFSFSFNE